MEERGRSARSGARTTWRGCDVHEWPSVADRVPERRRVNLLRVEVRVFQQFLAAAKVNQLHLKGRRLSVIKISGTHTSFPDSQPECGAEYPRRVPTW